MNLRSPKRVVIGLLLSLDWITSFVLMRSSRLTTLRLIADVSYSLVLVGKSSFVKTLLFVKFRFAKA